LSDPFRVLLPPKNRIILGREFFSTTQEELTSHEEFQKHLPKTFYSSILYWIERFKEEAKEEPSEVKLEVQKRQGCRLFHRDHVRHRIVVTYYGATTEWIPNQYINEDGMNWKSNDDLHPRKDESEDSYVDRRNQYVVKDWSRVQSAPFQGAVFMEGLQVRPDACVHRAPPFLKKHRVILVLTSSDHVSH